MQSLVGLYLYNNALTGTIPSEVAEMASLIWLSLEGNKFLGSYNAFCRIQTDFDYFDVDCAPDDDTLDCTCCTHCCDEDNNCKRL